MEKWIVEGLESWSEDKKAEFDTAEAAAEYIINNAEDTEEFEAYLDEVYPLVNVCGFEYLPSQALPRLDPVAYRTMHNDFMDMQTTELLPELARMYDGYEVEFFGFSVKYENPEEE